MSDEAISLLELEIASDQRPRNDKWRLITSFKIHSIFQWLAFVEQYVILDKYLRDIFWKTWRGRVEGHQQVGRCPEGMLLGKRLLLTDIQHRTSDFVVLKCLDQSRFIHRLPAPDVDEKGVSGQGIQ